MIIKINEKEYELKFTFNSTKYLGDFDFSVMQELDHKPFKLIGITEQLLFATMNHNPKTVVGIDKVNEYLEEVVIKGELLDLFEDLTKLMTESDFFKSLQVKNTKKKK
jgi:hypothetical protein